jgi:excisionase family DNA binding protein
MTNPFELIESRLSNIETLLLNLKFPSNSLSDPTKDELLTVTQVADILSISTATIYGYVHFRSIPCMKRKGRLYFSKKKVLNWVKEGERSTLDEIETNAVKSLKR